MHTLKHTQAKAKGFSLLEVLIAVLVLSIGLVSLAALQILSKQSNFEAVQRSTATALLEDLVERMRANPGGLDTYTANGAGRTLTGTTLSADSSNCLGASVNCNYATMSMYDLKEWEQALAGVTETKVIDGTTVNTGGLTSPTACISGPDGGNGLYTISIAWRGMTRLSNPGIDGCGSTTSLYHFQGTTDNSYRRVISMQTYIIVPSGT